MEQRSGGDWGDATCGDGDNEVDATTCVASGLTAATSYDFRVRAVPASSDSTKAASDWSGAATALTTGTAPPPPITGGSDDLNLQWSSDATAIEWDWDPVADRSQRGQIQNYVALLTETSQKCPALTVGAAGDLDAATRNESWIDQESTISADVPITEAGVTRGLCVVRTWEDDRKVRQFGDVQLAWAATPPAYPAGTDDEPNPSMRRPSSDRSATQSVTWKFETDMDVGYALRVLSASRNDGEQLPGSCNAGDSASAPAAATTNNVVIPHTVRTPAAYSQYQLCVRAENDQGQSGWTKIGGIALTRPVAPSGAVYRSADSDVTTETWGGLNPKRLVWTVAEKAGTPRLVNHYDIKVFRSTDNITAAAALQSLCSSGADSLTTGMDSSNASMGIQFEIEDTNNGFVPDELGTGSAPLLCLCSRGSGGKQPGHE